MSVVIADLLAVGVILCAFAAFHHVIPSMKSKRLAREASVVAAEATPSPTAEPEVTATPEPTEEPDNRTEWQKKFADRFSDEIVQADGVYISPNVHIEIEKVETNWGEYGNWPLVYYVADIYVASLDNFRTYTANNRLDLYGTQEIAEMDAAANSLITISGDFFGYQSIGYIVRNGVTYIDNAAFNDICVMFNDGSMETYKSGKYDVEELKARGVYQVWSFGPVLLDAEGHALEYVSKSYTVDMRNPRSAIGYYEPGHYCFVVVDGRNDSVSKGMTLPMLSTLFEELGCKCAYNLDGGGSAMMLYNGELLNNPSNGDRALSDILCIVETGDKVEGPIVGGNE